nr:ribonuclease H-like domain-containing protein [Tanacetum cinerariifolium]
MVNCNLIRTPIDTESKLRSDGDPVSNLTLHQILACSPHYITFTRPDISYAVQQVYLYMHDSLKPHYLALKRILWYVRGNLDYGLQLFSSSTTDLVAYYDTDWVGCPSTRSLTLGYCVFLGNKLLSWSSKRHPMLSRSNSEVEYHVVANAVTETCWLRNLLCPSASCDFTLSVSDIFTKGLPSALFEEFHSKYQKEHFDLDDYIQQYVNPNGRIIIKRLMDVTEKLDCLQRFSCLSVKVMPKENTLIITNGSTVRKIPRVLIVAGSDLGVGAKVQDDLKACVARVVYSSIVITVVTAQDTLRVHI